MKTLKMNERFFKVAQDVSDFDLQTSVLENTYLTTMEVGEEMFAVLFSEKIFIQKHDNIHHKQGDIVRETLKAVSIQPFNKGGFFLKSDYSDEFHYLDAINTRIEGITNLPQALDELFELEID